MQRIGGFAYVEGVLCCDGIPLTKIIEAGADETGRTPAYVYSETTLRENCHAVREAFPSAQVRYAVKACMNIRILELLRRLGLGFDVVSHGEMARVARAGGRGEETTFAGVGKTDYDIFEAVRFGATIVVERPEELPVIQLATEQLGKQIRVLLRLRPGVDAHTHTGLTTGTENSKFGMPLDMVRHILKHRTDYPRLNVTGIHIHIGSQIESPTSTVRALDVALPLIDRFHLSTIDIGGGFPVNYRETGSVTNIAAFGQAVRDAIGGRDVQLLIEPGRYITANAGVLVMTVLSEENGYSPRRGWWRTVVCDTGMGSQMRPALYDAYHQVWPVEECESPSPIPTSIAGPYCESTDFLARNRTNLPPGLRRGDRLVIMHTGGYGRAMAQHGYNGQGLGAELLVDRDRNVRVIARRESFADQMTLEMLTDPLV
ncbi:MAG: diaminopimelate decarboxylase [bacterium]|nr:diaminopimelate decarboxylase [bacterium]